jgi:GNAT superfamily N-acetyltransferase
VTSGRGPAAGPTGAATVRIRPATAADLPALPAVEVAAGALFADLGMTRVAQDAPPTVAELAGPQQDGRLWVAVADAEGPVGYLLLAVLDGAAHVEQVTVHPHVARRGIGRRLLDTADRWAAAQGLTAMTLTTFADVPWNAPYYARLGFRVLRQDELSAGLRRVRRREARLGLDAWPRVAMLRPVAPLPPDA